MMMMMESSREYNMDVKDGRISSVTVYQDRAEVTRVLSIGPLQTSGEHTVTLHSLTNETNPESIRVKGMAGCEILEVSHEQKTKSNTGECENNNDDAISSLKNHVRKQLAEQKALSQSIALVAKERKLIQNYADDAVSTTGKDQASLSLSDARELFAFHAAEMIRLDKKETELGEKKRIIDESLEMSRRDLSKLTAPDSVSSATILDRGSMSYFVSIVIDIKPDLVEESIELHFSYVVHNATWTPSYDLRIDSVSNELNLSYYAEVTQCTGEDWNECRLSLSTSNPAIGSAPPPLPNTTVRFEELVYGVHRRHNKKMKNSKMLDYDSDSDDDRNVRGRQGSFSLMDEDINAPISGFEPTMQTSSRINVEGTGDAGSTLFLIPRDVTICSDSKPHKVTVMITTLSPQMVHYVAPSVSSHAYIQAKTQNTSQYPLLASRKVSVFLDGSFVASSSSIDQTNSGEYFNVYLGVDPSIKVVYTPCRTTQQTKGWLNGTDVKKFFYSTVLHNTKQRPCKVIVAEVLPRSSTDKITVELMEPPASSLIKSSDSAVVTSERDVLGGLDGFTDGSQTWPKDFVTQNKFTNNIVWLKTIPAGGKIEMKFSYKVSWPQGERIEFN